MATIGFVAACFTALVLCLAAAVVRADPVPVTVCLPYGTPAIFQVMYLPQYYTWSNIAPRFKLIGFPESPSATPRGITLSLAQNGTDCNVYIGPLNSPMAQAVNAVMNSVWMAYSVTATEFSDRVNYPLFNRAVPTVNTNQRAIAALMAHYRWTTINIICTDSAYGQAAAAAVSQLMLSYGGTASQTCISASASYAVTAQLVQAALDSPSRVLFLASGPPEAAYNLAVQAVNALDVGRKLIVIFAEPPCSLGDPAWKTVPGSFCTTFDTDPDVYNPYYRSFLTRDTTAERAAHAAIGVPYPATANAQGGYPALGSDGARLIFTALDQYVATYGKLPATAAAAVAVTRNQTLPNGFTGVIEIPKGDRLRPAIMKIFNVGPNGSTSVIANFSAAGNLTVSPFVFVLNQVYADANVPAAVDPTTTAAPYWVIAVVLGALVIILVPLAYTIRQRQLLAVRPMDPAAPFAVMFVGVKNVDEVRDAGDTNSAAAFAQVANDLRAAVRASGCYEARRVDESTVMVVAKKVDNVLQCASQLMTSMDRVDWRAVMCHANEMAVLVHARHSENSRSVSKRSNTESRHTRRSRMNRDREVDEVSIDSRTRSKRSMNTMTSGAFPLLHVGIHYGFGMIDHDDSLNTVSYVGKVVSRAAEVADAAVAGQVLVSRETHEEAMNDVEQNGDASWTAKGAFERPDGWDAVAPDTIMFAVTAISERMRNAILASVRRVTEAASKGTRNAGGAAGGTIAAALQRADAGLSQRRIGAAVISIPELKTLAADSQSVASVADVVEELTSIAAVHRGEIHAMLDGTILITVNAGTPATQPVVRATLITLEAMQYLDSQQLSGSAGVAGGIALVGRPSQGAAFATFGTVAEAARLAQELAAAHGVKVCALDTNTYDDLAARLHVATISVAPNPGNRTSVCRLMAVTGERDATAGEWLYSVGSTNAGMAANETMWQQFVQMQTPSDDTIAAVEAEATSSTSTAWHALLNQSLSALRSYLPLLNHDKDSGDGAASPRSVLADSVRRAVNHKLHFE